MTAHAEGTTLASVGGWTANVTLLINTEYELDPANTDTTQLVLSNTNQTITGKSGGTTWGTSRSLTSHTTGRYYFEALLTSSVTGNALGICDANFSVTSAVLGFQGSAHAIGYAPATGVVTQSSVTVTTIQTCATTHTSCVAVDIDAGLIWYRTDAGNWNNSATANPATGAGGIAFTAAGTIYAAGSVFGGDTGNAWAFNLGSATFAQTVPAGFTAWGLTSPAHTATSAFAGVGGWTAAPYLIDHATALFGGIGGWTVDVFDPVLPANAAFAGIGGWLINVTDVAPPALQPISAQFVGVGGWIESDVQFDVVSAAFNGVGGWSESDYQIDQTGAEFDGVGGWSARPRAYTPNIYGQWQGSGGWTAWLASPRTQLYWRATSSSLIILDATSGTTFATPLLPDVSATLLFNVGSPIPNDYTLFSLTLTRPDGSSYSPYWDFYGIGEQVFNPLGVVETPAFRVGQYLVYAFAQGELDQPGPWTVTYQAGSHIVSMSFTLPPFNMLQAA